MNENEQLNETPAEIAVAIMAQIIAIQHGKQK